MIKQNILYSIFILASVCIAYQAQALVDTPEELIVNLDEEITLSGKVAKSKLIHVKDGGTIYVSPYDGGDNIGKLNLIAPQIIIDGTIKAMGVSCNTMGSGQGSSGLGNGAGGGGYGGSGGRGEDAGSPGAGGNTYNSVAYLEEVGSFGGGAGMGDDRSGFGGGCIRLDAISLTLGATAAAYLDARGNTTAHDGVGGGSGGCILLNGIYTLLNLGSVLNVSGGHGGSSFESFGAAGGGGGGRIKFVKHTFGDSGCSLLRNAGDPGSINAQGGISGEINEGSAPGPDSPQLISPANEQQVGRSPTFDFIATDPADSKFLKYQLLLSLNDSFTQLTYTASQLNSDIGWSKPYYASDEQASYTLQFELTGGTTYYWSVSVTSNEGVDWVDSGSRSLTATSNNDPCLPQLIQPAQNQIDVSLLPAFRVLCSDPDGDTLTFELALSRAADLSNPQLFDDSYSGWDKSVYTLAQAYAGVTATCQLLNADALPPNAGYYWQVRAFDQYLQSSVSDVFYFKTALTPPLTPQLIFPDDNYPAPDSRITFQFKLASDSGNTLKGRLELSENNFQNVWKIFDQTQDQTGWSEAFYQANNTAAFTLPSGILLQREKTYWWRVYALDGTYQGPVSVTRSFSLANTFEFQNVRTIPNPAVSVSTIQIYVQLSVDAEITIRFYNKMGKEVDQLHVSAQGGSQGNNITYDISQYAVGIYLYVIEAKSAFGNKRITKDFAVIN